jgi:hypothetical protein
LIGVVVVLVAIAVVWIVLTPQTHKTTTTTVTANSSGGQLNQTALPSNSGISANVATSGTITYNGTGVQATSILFTNVHTNETYSAGVNNSKYSIRLPNLQSYDIDVFWKGQYGWQNGLTPANHEFVLQQSSGNATENVNLPVPDALVKISGYLRIAQPNVTSTGVSIRAPSEVVFKDMYGDVFSSGVTTSSATIGGTDCDSTDASLLAIYGINLDNCESYNHGAGAVVNVTQYSVELPNWMNYNVTIVYNGLVYTQGTCSAGSLDLNAGLGTGSYNQSYVC